MIDGGSLNVFLGSVVVSSELEGVAAQSNHAQEGVTPERHLKFHSDFLKGRKLSERCRVLVPRIVVLKCWKIWGAGICSPRFCPLGSVMAFWNCQNRLSVDPEGKIDSLRPLRGLWNLRCLCGVTPKFTRSIFWVAERSKRIQVNVRMTCIRGGKPTSELEQGRGLNPSDLVRN